MGIGKAFIGRFGMRKAHQRMFERILKLAAGGLGYGVPADALLSERLEEEAFRASLRGAGKENFVVFDVGANRGMYIAMARRLAHGKDMVVHAFEPNVDLARCISEIHSGDPSVRVTAIGLSDVPGTATFHQHAQDVLSSFHAGEQHPSTYRNTTVSASVEVPITTIDAYCAEQRIDRIDHLKIDTEGHDLFVLRGARRMIEEGRISNIQFEFSEMNLLSRSSFFDHWNFLHPHYDLHRLCFDGLYRIEAYDPLLHEVYHVVNFFATLRK